MSTVNDIVIACRQRGIVMAVVEGVSLRVEGPDDALTEDLLSEIKNHKPELLAKLSEKRVTHADGRITEHSSRGLTEAEALEMARHFGTPVRAERIAERPPSLPVDTPLNLPGISSEFAARLSAEDLEDIATGDIRLGTIQAFEQAAIAREAEDLREHFEERAGILEFGAGLPRPEAEREAAKITATYARNRGYLWASLRAALADYPALLAQVPGRTGSVDSLPLGVAKLAVLKDRSVRRQGAFSVVKP